MLMHESARLDRGLIYIGAEERIPVAFMTQTRGTLDTRTHVQRELGEIANYRCDRSDASGCVPSLKRVCARDVYREKTLT